MIYGLGFLLAIVAIIITFGLLGAFDKDEDNPFKIK